MVSVIIFRLT